MKLLPGAMAIAALLFCVGGCHAQQRFADHAAFFKYVAGAEGWGQAFERRNVAAATPADGQTAIEGVAAVWGKVRLRPDALIVQGKPYFWRQARRPWGNSVPIAFDLELARAWESTDKEWLCLESSAGHNAGGTRWRHVVVIQKPRRGSVPALTAWTTPYGTCESVYSDAAGHLIAGVFEMTFESENAISSAAFSLRSFTGGKERPQHVGRYSLELPDRGNAFDFLAVKTPPAASPH